jgi:hypothetical protein
MIFSGPGGVTLYPAIFFPIGGQGRGAPADQTFFLYNFLLYRYCSDFSSPNSYPGHRMSANRPLLRLFFILLQRLQFLPSVRHLDEGGKQVDGDGE